MANYKCYTLHGIQAPYFKVQEINIFCKFLDLKTTLITNLGHYTVGLTKLLNYAVAKHTNQCTPN